MAVCPLPAWSSTATQPSGRNGDLHTFPEDDIHELKIDYGPGYRVYFTFKGKAVILLLCGGDKSSQSKDIERALDVAAHWEA